MQRNLHRILITIRCCHRWRENQKKHKINLKNHIMESNNWNPKLKRIRRNSKIAFRFDRAKRTVFSKTCLKLINMHSSGGRTKSMGTTSWWNSENSKPKKRIKISREWKIESWNSGMKLQGSEGNYRLDQKGRWAKDHIPTTRPIIVDSSQALKKVIDFLRPWNHFQKGRVHILANKALKA